MVKRKPVYEESFKKQLVELYNNGKPALEIEKEYHISNSALYKWVRYFNSTGSFKEKDNRTRLENDYKELEKENRQLKMENDILKQAALIMGRK
jgi:Transposase and inactivated derivatives